MTNVILRKVIAGLSLVAFVFCGADVLYADEYKYARVRMVDKQIKARGVKDSKLLDVMREVPRHKFIPNKYLTGFIRSDPYGDHPVSIGKGQTISQPYIVALMTELLRLTGSEKVLEIGTGSGYQAAVLSGLCKEVYTVEIVEELAGWAKQVLKDYKNVQARYGDGYMGWPVKAPFDAIIVTCSPDHIPEPLIEQLKDGGRMIIPVGSYPYQELELVEKINGKVKIKNVIPVSFVPMTGKEIEKRKK